MDNAWAGYLGTEAGSSAFYQGLSLLAANMERIRAEVVAAPLSERSKGLYLAAIDQLRPFLSAEALSQRTGDHLAQRQNEMERLELLEDVLPPVDRRDINPITLQELGSELQELLNALEETEMNAQLKAFLRLQLSSLLWAINSFDAIGMDGLSRTWGAVAAEITRAAGMRGADAPAAKSWLKQTLTFAGKMGKGVIFMSKVSTSGDALLEHGGALLDVASDVAEAL